MALTEICGMRDFDSNKNIYESDLNKFCSNFNFPKNLALPPFSNVSKVSKIKRVVINNQYFSSPLKIC